MVIPNPKGALRATESLLRNVIEMLVDAEGQARDGGLAEIETRVQSLRPFPDCAGKGRFA